MTDGFKPGARAYIIESNHSIRAVTIKRISGSLCLVTFDNGGGIQIGRHRLFLAKDAAEDYLAQQKVKKKKTYSFVNSFF